MDSVKTDLGPWLNIIWKPSGIMLTEDSSCFSVFEAPDHSTIVLYHDSILV
jgi:hypothetical protein